MPKNLWYKTCPKYQGDLAPERDHMGTYRTCIQCGFSQELREPPLAERAPVLAAATKEAA